jgi:tetratricopeptide (TPR) repeat protein
MNTNWKNVPGMVVIALLLSSPVMAQREGHGGGDGGGGGADHRDQNGRSSGTSRPSANYRAPSGHPNAGHLNAGHPYAGHPMGPAGYHPHPYYAHWYHGDWHDHWSHPWHYGPAAWFSVGLVAGAVVVDAPWHWGYYSYYNPYYTEVVYVDRVPIDYSQPIVLASPSAAVNSPQAESEAGQLLDVSRTAFTRGDYAQAMKFVNQAIAKRPSDPIPHEFRALILFATRQYRAATAAIYAVLSMGPGWDWATLCSFYPDPNVYTGQLRALEQYRNENPNLPDVRFLLAYQYMSCGSNDAAVIQLKEVVRLNPRDQLAAQLLAGLSESRSAAPIAPTQAAAPAPPVSADRLVGNWQAARPEGASIALDVAPDAAYHWRYTQNGKSQEFSGTYTMTDNLLILKNQGNPAMIGQITVLDANHFNFKMVGTPQSDVGLTFGKK